MVPGDDDHVGLHCQQLWQEVVGLGDQLHFSAWRFPDARRARQMHMELHLQTMIGNGRISTMYNVIGGRYITGYIQGRTGSWEADSNTSLMRNRYVKHGSGTNLVVYTLRE